MFTRDHESISLSVTMCFCLSVGVHGCERGCTCVQLGSSVCVCVYMCCRGCVRTWVCLLYPNQKDCSAEISKPSIGPWLPGWLKMKSRKRENEKKRSLFFAWVKNQAQAIHPRTKKIDFLGLRIQCQHLFLPCWNWLPIILNLLSNSTKN